jgi:hypothetical protein
MKTRRKEKRKIIPIASSRWAAYTAAAAASSLVAVGSAEAAIHYSGPINQKVTGGKRIVIPLDPAGGSLVLRHFDLFYGSSSFPDGGSGSLFVYAAVSGAAVGMTSACDTETASVSRLNQRDSISGRHFVPAGGVLATNHGSGCNGKRGQFLVPGTGFVGFKFNNGAGVQYGWARVTVQGSPDNKFKLVDFAYGDPGDTILAGQRSSHSASLESLGALALGGTALLAWRRRRAR